MPEACCPRCSCTADLLWHPFFGPAFNYRTRLTAIWATSNPVLRTGRGLRLGRVLKIEIFRDLLVSVREIGQPPLAGRTLLN